MRQKIAKNTLILLSSGFGSRFLVLLLAVFLARYLGPSDFGNFVFATAFVLTFVPLADFGIENYLLKEVPRRQKERVKILRELFYPRILLAILVYLLTILTAFLVGYDREDILSIALYGLMLLPYSLNYFFMAYFNAQEKFVKSSLLKIFYPLVYIGLSLLFVFLGLGYRWLLFASVLGNSSSAFFLVFFYHRVFATSKPSLRRLLLVIKKTWPFAALVFIAVIYLRIDIIILKRVAGSEATGLYGPASYLVETAILIPRAFALALFPLSSLLLKNNKKRMKKVYFKGLGVLFLVSLPIAALGIILAPFLVRLFLGEAYLASIPAIRVICLSLILFFVNSLAGNVILNSKKIKGFIPLALTNLGIAVILNLALIPSFFFLGSAWAKVGSETFGLVINNWYVWRILNEKT